MNLQDLVQKKVIRAYKYEDSIILGNNDELFELIPYGDCCSDCYITHVDGSEALKDTVILEVENISLPPIENTDDYEVHDVWGHRIHTTKGICTIEMRLDHNGYYGGELSVEKIGSFPKQGLKTLVDF